MKMHLNLATRDLNASVAFYRTLLLAEPAKHYRDYALFVTEQPGLELALDLDVNANAREGAHYGVVVEEAADVDAAIARLQAAGYPVDVETEETCCYAVQIRFGRLIQTAAAGRRITLSPRRWSATTIRRRVAKRSWQRPPHQRRAADVNLARRATAEAVGTALLLAAVVGSGIMTQRLAGGNAAIALLANTIATGGALIAIILAFGPVSGAHLNPAVTIVDAWQHGIAWREVPAYVGAQLVGAVSGVGLANLMFGLPIFFASHHARTGAAQWLSEFIATFGLLAVIWGCSRSKPTATPFAVGAYIIGAYWFTSSTSFANPAVTIARSLSDTFAGIRPIDTPLFIIAQFLGAAAATALFAYLLPLSKTIVQAVVVAHPEVSRAQATVSPSVRP